jgi:hypothetical protein
MRLFPKEPRATNRMVAIAWVIVALLAVLILTWLVVTVVSQSDQIHEQQVTNAAQDQALAEANRRLTQAGEQPVTTPPAGPPGAVGERGPGPSDAQVAAAVASYCQVSRSCGGKLPTAQQVAAAVSSYCRGGACVGHAGPAGRPGVAGAAGAPGSPGETGPAPTTAEIAAAVTAYCSGGRCTGPTGPAGSTGSTGPAGPAGRDGEDAVPFTFRFTVQDNPAHSTTYTVTCTADDCTVTTS